MLETERLILHQWNESDAEDLYEYAKDPDVGPIAGWPPHKSVEESMNVIRNVLCGKEAYAICLRSDNKAIGAIELKLSGNHLNDLATGEDECELGYWLGKPFWGQGIIPEAAREMIRHAFEDIGMSKVWCGYYDANTKSKRVQEKCGFRYQWTTEEVDVPLMHEKRRGHVNLLTREQWALDRSFALYDNHDDRIPVFELELGRSLDDLPQQALPSGYRFVSYKPGDRENWISIEKSAKMISSREEGLSVWNQLFAPSENDLPGQMIFVEDTEGKKVAAAAAFSNIRTGNNEKTTVLFFAAVRKEEQGHGLAKPMILEILHRMKTLGYQRAVIRTQTTSWLACKICLDLGFVPTPQKTERDLMGWRIIKALTGHPKLDPVNSLSKDLWLWIRLYGAAKSVQNGRQISDYVEAGGVSAAILSASGKIYTGVCVDTACTLGICAERNAIFNMLTNGEHEIRKVLALMPNGKACAPCGACRELIVQLMPEKYKDIEIMLDYEQEKTTTLGALTPEWWI